MRIPLFVCVCVYAHNAEKKILSQPSRLMFLEVRGSANEATALNVTVEVPLMDDQREVRCAKKQKQAPLFFFFLKKSEHRDAARSARQHSQV